jgi:hypothetical protein
MDRILGLGWFTKMLNNLVLRKALPITSGIVTSQLEAKKSSHKNM